MATAAWPNNLPEPLTSFVGRVQERDAARAALVDSRLLVMTGAGGSGKTRLALQLATGAASSFPDGAWWVDLAPVTEPDQIAGALADVLEVRPLPGRSLTQLVAQHLAGAHVLVVLDNCEHLLEAAADLSEALLRGCPQLTVLATSRTALRVSGETDWQVPPLSVAALDTPEDVAESDAGALFVERTRKARPDFALSDENAAAVGTICRAVDGLPLAIELAAARMRMMSVEQIAEGLRDRFRLLTGGPRGAAARQQTLRASVDWSYDLLDEPERMLFGRLAVFVGGWSLDAAEAVCAGDPLGRADVLDVLTSLIDKSLVVVEQAGPQARFRFLETVRQYSADLAAERDDVAEVAHRHLDHFAALAARAAPELNSVRVQQWIDALDHDSANLAAAVERAIETNSDMALTLTVSLTTWWRLRGQFEIGQRALTRALLAAADPTPTALRARALWGCGFLARFAGDVEAARRFSFDALEMAETVEDDWALAGALHSVASLQMLRAPVDSLPLFERGLDHARRSGDPWMVMAVLVNTVRGHLMVDDFDQASQVLIEANPHAEAFGEQGTSQIGSSAAWCAMGRGGLDLALSISDETAQAASGLGDPVSHALADMVGAWVELLQGRAEDALARMQACEVRVMTKGAFIAIPTTRVELARSLAALGRLGEARDILEALVGGGGDAGWHHTRALVALAGVLRAFGDTDGSRARATEALELGARVGTRWYSAAARELLASARIEDAEWSAAEALLHEALDKRMATNSPLGVATVLDGLARVAAGLDSFTESARLLGAADRSRADLGVVRWPLDVAEMTALEQMLRTQLGDERFTAAHAEGNALPLAEAIAWVRRARGSRKRPASGWEALTPTELRVVELVTEGLTNLQIAERMFISRGTVKIHLGHIFDKVEIRSRAELAALAVRRGVSDAAGW